MANTDCIVRGHYTVVNMLIKRVILAAFCCWIPTTVLALDDQWFVGAGGGSSWLVPNPVNPAIDDDEDLATYTTVLFGRDLSTLTSVQMQVHSLGTVALTNQQEVTYDAADVSLLYRFFDSRDSGFDPEAFGVSFYGRFGLGGIFRDEPEGLPLKNDTSIYFTGGAGFELYFTRNLALRLEAAYLEEDAVYGGLSLIGRFGGTPRRGSLIRPGSRPTGSVETPAQPTEQPEAPAPSPVDTTTPDESPTQINGPSVPAVPTVESSEQTSDDRPVESDTVTPGQLDEDVDGVSDAIDECPDSAAGYPVRSNGCPVLNGVLSGVKFADGSATLLPESFGQLQSLIKLLTDNPAAKVQIVAHTDNQGTAAEQSQITRARLRTIGTYLVRGGIRANRLILRSLGGSRPAYDNNSAEGRQANNRIELLEHR